MTETTETKPTEEKKETPPTSDVQIAMTAMMETIKQQGAALQELMAKKKAEVAATESPNSEEEEAAKLKSQIAAAIGAGDSWAGSEDNITMQDFKDRILVATAELVGADTDALIDHFNIDAEKVGYKPKGRK